MSTSEPQDRKGDEKYVRGRANARAKQVPPGRLELPAQGLGIPCSIRLSYGGTKNLQAFAPSHSKRVISRLTALEARVNMAYPP
jgi:hypothetical protein